MKHMNMHSDGLTSHTDFSAEDLELLAYMLEDEGAVDPGPLIRPRDPDAPIPLSFPQERLWFLDQWDPGNTVYNVPFAVRLAGPLNVDVLQRSLNTIVERHESLRTIFRAVDNQPQQIVASSLHIPLPILDLSHLPDADQETAVQERIAANANHAFDLTHGPLLCAELLRLGDQRHVFLLDIHHIVFDGWSVGLFLRELTVLYDAFVAGQPSPLPELPIQYPDFAIWQRAWLTGEVLQEQLAYWQRQLGGSLPVLELPGDHPRPQIMTNRGALRYRLLPPELAQQLNTLSQREGVTLFMTLFAAYQILLYRYTGETDIITGSAIANRDFVDIERLMGFFLNTLLLRTDLAGQPTFRAFLHQVRDTTLEAYAHQNVPFEQLVEVLRPPRDTSHTPLFQVMFILQNAPVPEQPQRDLAIEYLRVDNGTSKFDLTVSVTERADGLRAVAEYKTDLFEPATIDRFLAHYQTLLEGIVANPDCRIVDLPLLTDVEQHQWLAGIATSPPVAASGIHQLIQAQAVRTPEAVAVVWEDQHLSYDQLNRRANQVAHALRARGVQPEARIGLCVERSLDLIVGLLGILKAGAAYVPLDPDYPAERLAFIVEDAQIAMVLTQEALLGIVPASSDITICLDRDAATIAHMPGTAPDVPVSPEQLAYIIYTSGSTGRPKGVMIDHRALASYAAAAQQQYAISAGDRVLQFASITFDASVEEISTSLTNGATLVLRNDQMLSSPSVFFETCQQWQISVLSLPTAFWHLLAEAVADTNLPLPESLRLVIIGGERVAPARVAEWQARLHSEDRRHCDLINTYGPTEATVVATAYSVPGTVEAPTQEIPIGKPLSNTTAYVLDPQGQLVPIGVPGELYLGGVSLARGYLNRPELTADRFSPDPFNATPGARLYRTGDLARWLPDGTIEFLGRADTQVKLRGFRIELGEIEAVLRQHEAVREAVVLARQDTSPGGHPDLRLVAYLVPQRGTPPTPTELRSFLRTALPEYMVPSTFITLDQLPLTTSGKVNLRALPAPERGRAALAATLTPPRTPTEQTVAALWREVLKLEEVGIDDNFFELGGHSLLATQLIARLRTTFQVDLPLRHLFTSPTIAGVAATIETIQWMAQSATVPAADADESLEEGEL